MQVQRFLLPRTGGSFKISTYILSHPFKYFNNFYFLVFEPLSITSLTDHKINNCEMNSHKEWLATYVFNCTKWEKVFRAFSCVCFLSKIFQTQLKIFEVWIFIFRLGLMKSKLSCYYLLFKRDSLHWISFDIEIKE